MADLSATNCDSEFEEEPTTTPTEQPQTSSTYHAQPSRRTTMLDLAQSAVEVGFLFLSPLSSFFSPPLFSYPLHFVDRSSQVHQIN